MGNPFSKDGVITKITEALPCGGFITAPVHAAAGNSIHAAQAAIGGFGTPAGAVTGPVGAIVSTIGTAGLQSIFDQCGLDDDKKSASIDSCNRRRRQGQGCGDAAAGQQKINANVRQLSAESGGRKSLKSMHGTYLRAYDSEYKVDMAQGAPRAWENWYVEDHGGKVVFKAIHSPGRSLRAHPNGHVDLTDRLGAWETWKPFKNDDGSWSFLSVHGRWLSADVDRSVTSVEKCRSCEHFWLEWW